jgi:hypothetical protein
MRQQNVICKSWTDECHYKCLHHFSINRLPVCLPLLMFYVSVTLFTLAGSRQGSRNNATTSWKSVNSEMKHNPNVSLQDTKQHSQRQLHHIILLIFRQTQISKNLKVDSPKLLKTVNLKCSDRLTVNTCTTNHMFTSKACTFHIHYWEKSDFQFPVQ